MSRSEVLEELGYYISRGLLENGKALANLANLDLPAVLTACDLADADELQSHLEDLKIILLALPRYLPVANEFYNFGGYMPEPESVQDYGEEGVLN